MKKLLLTSTAIVMLTACHSNEQNSDTLKGANYISTDVGATYTYKMSDADYKIVTTVNSCNNEKTTCDYTSKMLEKDGTIVNGSEKNFTYTIKNGAVYQIDKDTKDDEVFPATIELNKMKSFTHDYDYGQVSSNYSYTKYIPEISVNGKTYKNCVQIDADATTKFKKQRDDGTDTYNLKSVEIYCKGIGQVQNDITQGSPATTSSNTLVSITK